jgi:ABC-2 type transport system permease protein
MFALVAKEVRGFLGSLIGHITLVVFLLLTGLSLWVFQDNILDSTYADLSPLFRIAPWVFLFLVPAVTMRSFSEEKRTGTLEFLLTKPLTELQAVVAKYLAAVLLVLLALLPTLVYVHVVDLLSVSRTQPPDDVLVWRTRWLVALSALNLLGSGAWLLVRGRGAKPPWGPVGWAWRVLLVLLWAAAFTAFLRWALFLDGIDSGATWGSYIGLFLLGALFAAIGVFASSLTDSQIVAFLVAVFLCFFLYLGFDLIASFEVLGGLEGPLRSLGIQAHYSSLGRGVVDLRDVLYHLGAIVILLLLTRTVLQSRTW